MKHLRGPILTAGLLLAATACGTSPQSTSVVCTDFRAGADLSESTFGIKGELRQPYVSFAQATGDLAAAASQMLQDVGASCRGLAIALGANPSDPRAADKLEPDAVRAWCTIAAERFAAVRPRLTRGHFTLRSTRTTCNVDTAFQVDCEQKCAASESCREATAEERCPIDAREGICPGVCTGTCSGSEEAPAQCAGGCQGTCFGTCADDVAESADCSTGCVCASTCHGVCTASCTLPGEGGHCASPCVGTCNEPMVAPTCSKPLSAPTCAGNLDCQKSCSASGSARAVCRVGSLTVSLDRTDDPALIRIVAALERTLPAILLASQGRAKALGDGAENLLDSAGNFLKRGEELGPMATACGILIGETGEEARTNLRAALAGSRELASAVTVKP